MTIDEMHELLRDLADEVPQELFEDLNGGISLVPDVVYSPHAQEKDLYILAQYHRGGPLGRYITLHYGSFIKVYGHLPAEEMKKKLRHTLRHEFRHHIESLAGVYDLEIEDKEYIEWYLEKKQGTG